MNFNSNNPEVSEKKFQFCNLSDLWPRSKNDLDLGYSVSFIYLFC